MGFAAAIFAALATFVAGQNTALLQHPAS